MTETQKALNFLEENRHVFSIAELERMSNIPIKTIRHALNGTQPFPEKHLEALTNTLKKYGYASS